MLSMHSCSLSTLQWTILLKHLFFNLQLFCKPHRESLFLQFIINRTIPYHKLEEYITYEIFENGSTHANMLIGTGISKQNLSITKSKLKSHGIIFTEEDITNGKRKTLYKLNLVGILETIITIRNNFHNQTQGLIKQTEKLSEILQILKPFYKKLDTSITVHLGGKDMTLAEVEKHTRLQALEHRNKKRGKRKIESLKSSWVKDYFKECCESHGTEFADSFWTRRDWGSMKNFLRECKEDEKDPRVIIDKACEFWSKFQFRIISDEGKPVHLLPNVNVRQFYTWRGQIIDWVKNLQTPKVVPMGDESGIAYFVRCPKTNKRFKVSYEDYNAFDNEIVTSQELADKYLRGNINAKSQI